MSASSPGRMAFAVAWMPVFRTCQRNAQSLPPVTVAHSGLWLPSRLAWGEVRALPLVLARHLVASLINEGKAGGGPPELSSRAHSLGGEGWWPREFLHSHDVQGEVMEPEASAQMKPKHKGGQ